MKITTRFSMMTSVLIAVLVTAITALTVSAQRSALQAQSLARQAALQEGVVRIAQESQEQRDPLMLVSYLMHIQRSRPEVVYAAIARGGHTSTLGADGPDLAYWTQAIESKSAAEGRRTPEGMTLTLGYSKARLQADIAAALDPLMARTAAIGGLFVVLGWVGAFSVAKLLTAPISALTAAVTSIGRKNLEVEVPSGGRDEIGELGRRFNEMTGRVRELVQFREDVLHTLTHELSNPLGGVKGYLEIWQEKGLPADPVKRGEALSSMESAVLRMENSLHSALKLFGGEEESHGEKTLIWLDEMASEVVTLFAPIARTKKIRVTMPSVEAVDCVYADEEMVRRIVSNLVSNALKYTPDGGLVEVTYGVDDTNARFSVRDTGVGIAPEDLKLIFTKFYRAGERSSRIPGSGLGLAIAQRAARSLGGDITVTSELGKGSVFTVQLPRNLPKTNLTQETRP